MKRHYLSTALSCLLILALAFSVNAVSRSGRIRGSIRVWFRSKRSFRTATVWRS